MKILIVLIWMLMVTSASAESQSGGAAAKLNIIDFMFGRSAEFLVACNQTQASACQRVFWSCDDTCKSRFRAVYNDCYARCISNYDQCKSAANCR